MSSLFDDALEKLKRRQQSETQKAKTDARSKTTPVRRRMLKSSAEIHARIPDELLFQHTVLCQTVLPYRDPGTEVRIWERQQGNVRLSLEAGRAKDPQGQYVPVGLPFGATARLILCHLNTEALRTGSPVIEMDTSLSAFIRDLQGYAPNGKEIAKFKEQLTRLSAALIRLSMSRNESRAVQINTQIVSALDLWVEQFDGERVLSPKSIKLSADYFASLQEHAIPLDERAVAALAHSAMGLDVYCWLAQRLHRVDPKAGQLVPWVDLHQQFGQGYERIRKFREVFLEILKTVKDQYPAARFSIDEGGMLLAHSPSPVPKRSVLIEHPPQSPKSDPKRSKP
ncbi:MAG: plasmid encoded RepA protein [Candidatus Competibacteraceae bacterium]|nr:plasmid encoded RepA protein [Candidatus Competibacteraceae bacterium]